MKLITKFGKDTYMVYEDKDLATPEEAYRIFKRLMIYAAVSIVYLASFIGLSYLFFI